MVGEQMEKESIKNKIIHFDNKIDESKRIKQLNKLEDDFLLLDKSFGKCLSLLAASIKGRKVSVILDQSSEVKNKCINESLSIIGKNKDKIYNVMQEDIKNKEKLEKDYKKSLEKEKKQNNVS